MILALLITVIVEGVVAIGYSLWRRKPSLPILLTSAYGNLITQSLLWVVLNILLQNYLVTLLVAELSIWVIESLLLYAVPANRLRFSDAIFLSLGMNLASFTLGWFLPI